MREDELAAHALTSRVVAAEVAPFSAREFWRLARTVDDLGRLFGLRASEIQNELSIPGEQAERVARLMERRTALALATEELEHSGMWVLTSLSEDYPTRLRDRLGDSAPVVLHGVGDKALLGEDGVGVVGSRDIPPESAEVAREVARIASGAGVPIVSGAARGVDQHAMNAVVEFGGRVVGVLADSLQRTVGRPSTRRAVASGQICLVTPYAPRAGFSAGNAMGRNKIIYALSRAVLIVRSDEGTGGTWTGANEAISGRFTQVLSWTGAGSGPGNGPLVTNGAAEVADLPHLKRAILQPAAEPGPPVAPAGDQLSFF